MNDVYLFVLQLENAEILTLIALCVGSFALLSFIWSNAHQKGLRMTTFQWTQIYSLGTVTFLSGVMVLGKLAFRENSDKLLDLLYLSDPLSFLTRHFQSILLTFIRAMM